MVNKKAFTLSVNFLVTMIIMIVLFGFGIYLFTTVFNKAVQMNEEISNNEIERMNKLLDSGERVAVLNFQQTAGKDSLRFPIGITNENGAGTNKFNITITDCNFEKNSGGFNSCPGEPDTVIQIAQDTQDGFNISNNRRKYRLLLVDPQPGDSGGFYSIQLQVYRESDPYGKKQMIFVTVP